MTLCTVGISCDWLIVEYTHEKFCGILLLSDACNNSADIVVWEYAMCYPLLDVIRVLVCSFPGVCKVSWQAGSCDNGWCQYVNPCLSAVHFCLSWNGQRQLEAPFVIPSCWWYDLFDSLHLSTVMCTSEAECLRMYWLHCPGLSKWEDLAVIFMPTQF